MRYPSAIDRRLTAVVEGLYERGALRHRANVDGWELAVNNSDWGEISASMSRSGEVVRGFELDQDNIWRPIYLGTEARHLAMLTEMAERAEWHYVGTISKKEDHGDTSEELDAGDRPHEG